MFSYTSRRWRGRTVAVLFAAAVPLARERVGGPGGAVRPRAPRVGGQEAPRPQGRGDRPVQGRRVRAQGPRARALPPRPRDRPAPGHQRPRHQAPGPPGAGAARAASGSSTSRSTRACAAPASTAAAWRRPTRRPSARTSCGPPASPARASASPSSTPGISGDMPDFKSADGSSRITANVIANPGATRPGDDVGHGTHVAGIIAGNSFNRAAARPGARRLRRHRPRGRPDRAQGRRRRRRLDDARRHHGARSSPSTTRTSSTSASSTSR